MLHQFYYSYFSSWAPVGQPQNNNSQKKSNIDFLANKNYKKIK